MTNVFETEHITGNLLTLFPFSSYPLICGIMQWHSCTKHSATRRSGEDCGPFHCPSNNITYLLILFINGVKSRANTRFMKLIKNAYTYGASKKWCSTWQWPYSQMYHKVKGQLSGTDAHKNRQLQCLHTMTGSLTGSVDLSLWSENSPYMAHHIFQLYYMHTPLIKSSAWADDPRI
jgi:hypothetical protein